MIHLRYIVYKNPETSQKQVDFWMEDIIHSTYAREHHILPINLTSAGYMRPTKKGWVSYEHYQLNEDNPKADTILVHKSFQRHTEFQTPEIAQKVHLTYMREKKEKRALLFSAIKELLRFRSR